jgi:hypothetical protein
MLPDKYPPAFRAAWQREFGLDVFSVDHLASLFDRIENPDKYRDPDVALPPALDVERFAKRMLHTFVDSLDSGSMPGARDKLKRAAAQSRRRYPRIEAIVMLSYVYMVETGCKITKQSLWEAVDERCKHLDFAPPHERTRPRLLRKLGLAKLPKGRSTAT